MPHNENYYYAAYFAALGIYLLYTISIMRRRLTIARRRLALRREPEQSADRHRTVGLES